MKSCRGRTRDANLQYLAEKLNSWGIQMREARVIPDIEQVIIDAIHECREKYDYVFTTGGIGPTHDDITAATVAKAFGRELVLNQETYDRMASHYFANNMGDFNEARQKMCYVPDDSTLIGNSISIAPGFRWRMSSSWPACRRSCARWSIRSRTAWSAASRSKAGR